MANTAPDLLRTVSVVLQDADLLKHVDITYPAWQGNLESVTHDNRRFVPSGMTDAAGRPVFVPEQPPSDDDWHASALRDAADDLDRWARSFDEYAPDAARECRALRDSLLQRAATISHGPGPTT